MESKVKLDFLQIVQRLKQCTLPDVDHVVGIGSGGVVPASLVAFYLERPLSILPINFRAPDNSPRHPAPQLLGQLDLPANARHILLVDDVSVSGQTLSIAREALTGYQITTLVMKGQADFVLFPEIAACVNWPWKTTD
ncbi:MAG: phosphoribosyltransferase [Ardenticatenaceae bacterium]|nr:phosphoribosyltransferase [Ardenticatenaceae bacterium]